MLFSTKISGKAKQTYEGFRRLSPKRCPANLIAVAFIEGEVETWEIDETKETLGLEELQRFYRSEHEGLDVDIVIYRSPTLYLTDTGE